MRRTLSVVILLSIVISVNAIANGRGKFDRLSDTDRKSFAARFEKEIWPLLKRNGKNGCVGCHDAKHRSALRFSGKPDADFRMLLGDGFFLIDDPGSIQSMVSTKDERLRMPPGDRPRWSMKEIEKLRKFVLDVDAKQGK